MTNYNLKAITPPSLEAQQKKEKRRKVLEAVWERRKEIFKRFYQKMQVQADKKLL